MNENTPTDTLKGMSHTEVANHVLKAISLANPGEISNSLAYRLIPGKLRLQPNVDAVRGAGVFAARFFDDYKAAHKNKEPSSQIGAHAGIWGYRLELQTPLPVDQAVTIIWKHLITSSAETQRALERIHATHVNEAFPFEQRTAHPIEWLNFLSTYRDPMTGAAVKESHWYFEPRSGRIVDRKSTDKLFGVTIVPEVTNPARATTEILQNHHVTDIQLAIKDGKAVALEILNAHFNVDGEQGVKQLEALIKELPPAPPQLGSRVRYINQEHSKKNREYPSFTVDTSFHFSSEEQALIEMALTVQRPRMLLSTFIAEAGAAHTNGPSGYAPIQSKDTAGLQLMLIPKLPSVQRLASQTTGNLPSRDVIEKFITSDPTFPTLPLTIDALNKFTREERILGLSGRPIAAILNARISENDKRMFELLFPRQQAVIAGGTFNCSILTVDDPKLLDIQFFTATNYSARTGFGQHKLSDGTWGIATLRSTITNPERPTISNVTKLADQQSLQFRKLCALQAYLFIVASLHNKFEGSLVTQRMESAYNSLKNAFENIHE